MKIRGNKNYFLELITIVVGIMLSFFINEWRENSKNKEKEITYLQNIKEELYADTSLIRDEINILGVISRGADTILNLNFDRPRPDSIELFIKAQTLYSTLPQRRITYHELQQTGESRLIKNRELLRDIINYYESVVWEIKEYNKIDENHVLNHLIPYYSAHFDMEKEKGNRQVINDLLFRNLLRFNKGFKEMQINLYKKQLKEIEVLGNEIKNELEKLGAPTS
ncbi:MAG: hypothetical protein KDC24_09510 [Saprospiraceae bacterium]|nr:hypothetical protein [Saprospiraceae bacterium]